MNGTNHHHHHHHDPPVPPARSRPTRRGWAAAAAAMTLVGVALVAPGASAHEAGGDAPAGDPVATPPVTTDLAPGSYQVTLLTGDRVQLRVAVDGRLEVSLTPEVRADGSAAVLNWYADGEGVYVVPSDAEPLVADGRLDPKLFDVAYLAANGFTDDAGTLPLIVQYADGGPGARTLQAAGADPGAGGRPLPSIDASAVEVDHDDTVDFWASVQAALAGPPAGVRTTAAAARVERIWLDRVARVVLDESVPLIGAPQAWDAGLDGTGVRVAVLDTGIDAGHPDVAGRIAAARSFVDGEDVVDGHGHGTHVATTIAGSGAASGGTYTGVAPAADLVVGKVCTNGGSCPNSAVIAGMEWAVLEQDADVVNLSLGGCCTDGTDPLSQAVNQLSADTGALFVIAAGNDGPAPSTVGAPGTADAALTVASVTKAGGTAGDSSRGPRLGDSAFKPEIAAPGVDIVAGRAAGTAMGFPVDDHYTSASGTSMATPHVTGAAALLAQRHPDWDGQLLKAALVASAHDLGHHGYAQGAGRVDLARAIGQQVQVSPPVADFRFVEYPPAGPPMTRTLTYTNPTGQPVTLSLAGSLTRTTGAAVPEGTLTLDRDTVTVPAGGTATVTVTVDQTALDAGSYTGAVVATDGGSDLRLRTPVGIVVGEQLHKVSVELTPRTCDNDVHCTGGFSSFSFGDLRAWRLGETPAAEPTSAVTGAVRVPLDEATSRTSGSGDGYRYRVADDGTVSVDVFLPEGRYALRWEPRWLDRRNRVQYPWVWAPDVVVPGAPVLAFDANQAVKVTHHTPLPTGADGLAATRAYHRVLPDGALSWGSAHAFGHGNLWGYPTAPVDDGAFLFSHEDVLEAPQLTMTVAGPEPVRLNPIYSGYRPASHPHSTVPVRFPEGTRTLPVVDVGTGGEADYDGVDVTGALVLVRNHRGPGFCTITVDRLQRALDAGAAGVLYHAEACRLPVLIHETPANEDKPQIPYVALPSLEADLLAQRLAAGPVEITVTSHHVSPYVYFVGPYEDDRVPETLAYHYPHDQLVTVQASYHGRVSNGWADHTRFTFTPGIGFDVGQDYAFAAPAARTEYLTPVGERYLHQRVVRTDAIGGIAGEIVRWDVFTRPGRVTERWNGDPWTPGAAATAADGSVVLCAGCREGDTFWPFLHVVGGDAAATAGTMGWSVPHSGDVEDPMGGVALYRDGQPVPVVPFLDIVPAFPLPAEEGDYRLVNDFTASGYTVHTEWEFTSGPLAGDEAPPAGYACLLGGLTGLELPCRVEPLIFLRYSGLDTDLYQRVAAPGAHHFEVATHRQASPQPRPAVAGLTVEVSYDGGATWERAKARSLGDGRYAVTVIHPPENRRASDSVTLRVEAWDADGNRVRQTLTDVYRLTGRGPGQCGGPGCAGVR